MIISRLGIFGTALAVLVSCGEGELILDGPRIDVRDTVTGVASSEQPSRAFTAPAQVNHAAWTHRGGSASHKLAHPALGTDLTQIWSVDIGQGNKRKARITADPVVAGGRIFTMDSASQVTAVGTNGGIAWSRLLVPATDKASDATGGGLAYDDGTVFATTGFGELFALDAATGAERWRQKLEAPVTAAPTVFGGMVYVATRDSRAWGIDTRNGKIKWQLAGSPAQAVVVGGPGAVVSDRLAIFPFGSGELVGALRQSGIRVWGSNVAGNRRGRAYAAIRDVTGDPVLDNGRLYAANQSGRMVALDANSGARLWSAEEGAHSPVFPAGNSLFLISDQNELVRLDAATGATVWSQPLPYYTTFRLRRRDQIYAHHGPVLAGGRLIVASDDGQLRSFDPASGALVGSTPLRGGAATNPAIVNRTLYVVTTKGQLAAFR